MGGRYLNIDIHDSAEGLKMDVSISRDILETLLSGGRDTLHAKEVAFEFRRTDYEIVRTQFFPPEE